jgi:SAM-dependent methyltransferase
MQMLGGYYAVWVVHAAAQLGLADRLKDGPLSVEALATACAADAGSLGRFLEAVEGYGLVARTADGRWELTAAGAWLRGDVAGSLKPSALMCGEESFFRAWSHCADAVRSGRPSFETANGASFFAYLDAHAGLQREFQGAMTSFPYHNAHILSAFDFGAVRSFVDLGGGTGSLARAIRDAHPAVRCRVLDRPTVIEANRQSDSRIEWVAGDFLEAVPEGGDCHALRFVLSDWSDEDTLRVFRNSHRALVPGGTLIVVDNLRAEGVRPSPTAGLDIMMMVLTGGRVRSADEYARLMEQAGFTYRRTIVTPARVTLIVGQR